MSYMFYQCQSLTTINLSKFDTKNVKDMSSMFCNCISLTEKPNLKTKNVEKKKYMYFGCKKLFEKEQTKLIKDYNNINEEFSLKKWTQYNLYPRKEKTDSSNINQLLITYNKIINPFINNNEDFNKKIKSEKKEIESKINELGEIYDKPKDNILLSNISHLNVTQVIENNYNFSFCLKSVKTDDIKIFNFNKYDRTLLFILFNLNSLGSINKIKEIKKYEIEVANNDDKKFELIAMIRENSYQDIQEKLKLHDLNFCWFISEKKDSNFIKLFGFDEVINSRCVFINKNAEISLIFDDSIEYLTKEMIDFYLGRKSEIKKMEPSGFFQNEQQILELKTSYESDIFKKKLKKLEKEFNLEIEFKEIDETKYPAMIKFRYSEEEKTVAQDIIKELNKIMETNNIKYYFLGEEIKSNNKINKLIKKIITLEKEIIEKEEKLEEDIKQIEEKIPKLKEEQSKNNEEIRKLEEIKKSIEESITKEKENVESKKEKKKIEEEKNKIEDKIKKLEEKKNENDKEIKKLRKEINKKEEEINKLEKEKQNKKEQIKKTKKIINHLKLVKLKLKNNLRESEKELQNLKKRVNDIEKEKNKKEGKINNLIEKENLNEEKNVSLQKIIKELIELKESLE